MGLTERPSSLRCQRARGYLQGRPSTTGRLGKVSKVADEKTLLVGRFALEANTGTTNALWVEGGFCVDAEVEVFADGLEEAEFLGFGRALVAHEATGRVDIVVVGGRVVALKGKMSVAEVIVSTSRGTYHKEAKLVKKVGRVKSVCELV